MSRPFKVEKILLKPSSVSDLEGLTLEPARSRFESLPQNVRHCVYKFLLSSKHTVVDLDKDERLGERNPREKKFKGYSFKLEIFRVNKSIYLESLEFFYRENKFVSIHSNAPEWITTATAFLPILSRKSSDGTLPYSLSVELTVGNVVPELSNAIQVDTILAAYDLPVFVHCLRVSLLSVPQDKQVTVNLNLRDAPWGKEVYSKQYLEPFTRLVRIHTVNLSDNADPELAEKLRTAMQARPPIGPDLLRELKGIRRFAERRMRSNDLRAAKKAYKQGRALLSLQEDRTFSRAGLIRLGGPFALADLLAESISYDVHLLTFCFHSHYSDDGYAHNLLKQAMEIENRVLNTVEELLPQYGSCRKAKLFFELGCMHRRLADLRNEYKEGPAEFLKELRKAYKYLEKSTKLAPGDARYTSLFSMVREKVRQLESEVMPDLL